MREELLRDWVVGGGFGRDVFSPGTLALGERFGYFRPSDVLGYVPSFRELAPVGGDSREFQRLLYRQLSGLEPPESYGGFHASQADRIENVFDPSEVDVEAMREVAFVATALREFVNSGFGPWGGGEREPVYRVPSMVGPVGGGGGGGGVRGGRERRVGDFEFDSGGVSLGPVFNPGVGVGGGGGGFSGGSRVPVSEGDLLRLQELLDGLNGVDRGGGGGGGGGLR